MTVSLNTNPTQNTETIPNANPKANLHTVIDHSNKDQKMETSMSRRRLISLKSNAQTLACHTAICNNSQEKLIRF
jgi:hypothetical protein